MDAEIAVRDLYQSGISYKLECLGTLVGKTWHYSPQSECPGDPLVSRETSLDCAYNANLGYVGQKGTYLIPGVKVMSLGTLV